MSATVGGITALGDHAARQLANATKTVPQLETISPRWLTHLLQWVPVEAGIYQRDYNHTVKFRLTQALLPNKRYTVVVTPKIKDYRGVPLDRSYSFSFVTAAAAAN